jgi:hypothetical protein
MDGGTVLAKRPRLNRYGKALRRERIFARLRGGWAYEDIAREEHVTIRRVRQIVSEALRRRQVDDGSDHAMLQLARLEQALRLAAEAVAEGEIAAIAPYLKVLAQLDRYQGAASVKQTYDEAARERLFAKINRIAARQERGKAAKPAAPTAGGVSPDAAEAPEPERIEAVGLDSPASP